MVKDARQKYSPDEIDQQIINLMSEDGRISYRDLADQVSLSETRVRVRVLRLIDEGYISIVAIPNLIKLGANIMAMLGIRSSGDIEELAEHLSEDDRVTFLSITTGSYDIMAEIVCANSEAFLNLLQQIRSLPGVKETESFVYLKTPKSLYGASPGTISSKGL